MSEYDGSIRIGTKIETKNLDKNLATLENKVIKSAHKVEKLRSELTELGKTQIPTTEFKEVEKQLTKAETDMARLQNRMDKFLETGGDKKSKAFQRMQYDLAELENTIEYVKGEKQDMIESGTAYTSGKDTQAYKDKEVALQMENNLLDQNQKKLEKVQAQMQKNATQSGRLGKAMKKAAESGSKAFEKLKGTLKKVGLMIIGVRSVRALFMKMHSALVNTLPALQQADKVFGSSMKSWTASTNQLKGSFASAFSQIAMVFIPIMNKLASAIANVVDKAAQLFAYLRGAKTWQKAVGSAVDKVGASAKKAANNFTSLDEVSTWNSGNDGGGGGGSSSGVEFSEQDIDMGAIGGIAEKIKSIFDELKTTITDWWSNLDFSNLIDSFDHLKEVLAPFGENVGQGLKWFLENILLPLSGWIITEVVPEFLDILSGAISIVNKAIEDLSPIWEWFWDNVLQPIASWTGGVIVDILDGIGNALEWISQNEVAMSIIEGVAIAIGLVSAAILVFNVVMAIANGVVAAFGVVMAIVTSPITLIIAIIAALIAIGILLYKNWDEIKEKASEVWENIKEKISNVITKVKEKISGFINNVKTSWSNGWDNVKNKAQTIWNAIHTSITNTINKIKNGISTSLTSIKTKWTTIWTSVKTTTSSIFNGIWNAIRNTINSIIAGVEKMANGVISAINGMIGALNKLSFTIPDWVGGSLGGKSFGLNLSTIGEIHIPRLATGTVVPANYGEFAAILGDNKKETEVVSPLSTIEQALRNVLSDGSGSGGSYQFIAQIDRKTLFNEVIEEGKMRRDRTGRNPFDLVRA